MIRSKIEVLADDFSLRERGISSASLGSGVQAAPIDSIIERMSAGWNALWHWIRTHIMATKHTLTFVLMDAPFESDAAQEDHPLSKNWIASLMTYAREHGADLNWVNCGLCVDQRGVGEAIEGVRRGSPADCWKMEQQSTATLVIPTK